MNDALQRGRRPAHDPARAKRLRFERAQRIAAGLAPPVDAGNDGVVDDEAGRALVETIAGLDADWTAERRVLLRSMRLGWVLAYALVAAGIAPLVVDVVVTLANGAQSDEVSTTALRLGEIVAYAGMFALVGTASVVLQRVGAGYQRYRHQRDRWVGLLVAHRAGYPVADAPPR